VVIGSTPRAEEGIIMGVVGLGVVEEVTGVMDLIVSQVFEGWRAIDNMGGDVVVDIGVGQGLGTLKALGGDVG
jgi:hypothetical protein